MRPLKGFPGLHVPLLKWLHPMCQVCRRGGCKRWPATNQAIKPTCAALGTKPPCLPPQGKGAHKRQSAAYLLFHGCSKRRRIAGAPPPFHPGSSPHPHPTSAPAGAPSTTYWHTWVAPCPWMAHMDPIGAHIVPCNPMPNHYSSSSDTCAATPSSRMGTCGVASQLPNREGHFLQPKGWSSPKPLWGWGGQPAMWSTPWATSPRPPRPLLAWPRKPTCGSTPKKRTLPMFPGPRHAYLPFLRQ